jgi:hypothetical protein
MAFGKENIFAGRGVKRSVAGSQFAFHTVKLASGHIFSGLPVKKTLTVLKSRTPAIQLPIIVLATDY